MKNDARIFDYVEAAILTQLRNNINDLTQYGYITRPQLEGILAQTIRRPTETFGISQTVDRLVQREMVEVISDEFAGDFYSFSPNNLVNWIDQESAKVNSVFYKMRKVGLPFFDAAFDQAMLEMDDSAIEYKSMEAPGSDRIVSLTHNQVDALDEPTSELISAVERENAIPDSPGLRELIIGQLKAGRELIRVGVFKVELLYATLVIGLKMLIEKYKDHAIAALASKLLDLVLQQVGIG